MDLITLEEYKTYKGVKTTDDDGRILQIIAHVSALVKHFCNRSFIDYYSTDKVEYHDSRFSTLYLRELPLISITTVEYSTDGGQTYEVLVDGENYIIDQYNDTITTGSTAVPFASEGLTTNGMKVTYKGGFLDCPEDLKICSFDIVDYYRSEQYIPKKVMSGATSDNEVFRLMRSERFPIHIQRVLNLYRIVV